MYSKLLLIQLDQNMNQINEKSIKRPTSYKDLTKFVIKKFKINSFIMYYFDETDKEINITNDEDFKKSGDLIFIADEDNLTKSVYERIYPDLSDSKKNVIDENYLCNLCLEKLTENPYFCYQCSKRICKKCLRDLNKKMSPLKCPFCKYELPFEKWFTLRNFFEEKQKYLELIEENIKLKDENLKYNKKEKEFFQQIKIQNFQIRVRNEKIKDQEVLIQKKDEEIKNKEKLIQKKEEKIENLKEELININKIKNDIQEKEELTLLTNNEKGINKPVEEKNDLPNPLKKTIGEENKANLINQGINEILIKNDSFIYYVDEDHIDKKGYINILGENFVNNNKGSLIINDDIKLDYLVSKYKLKIGINKIILNINNYKNINFSYMFYNCKSLIDISPLKNLNVSSSVNFNSMFSYCELLNDISPLKNWNVSNGENFSWMFSGCNSLNDISSLKDWDVNKGNNFSYMFYNCKSLTDISPLKNWNVSNGNNFSFIFSGCYSLKDTSPLKDWDISSGNNFRCMFFKVKNISEDMINNFKQLNPKF